MNHNSNQINLIILCWIKYFEKLYSIFRLSFKIFHDKFAYKVANQRRRKLFLFICFFLFFQVYTCMCLCIFTHSNYHSFVISTLMNINSHNNTKIRYRILSQLLSVKENVCACACLYVNVHSLRSAHTWKKYTDDQHNIE